jgi:multicomponent Na+:H+ antiporter subunit D
MVFAAPAVRGESPIVVIVAVAAGLTMVVGILCALAMRSVRRTIAMTLVAHIGFPLLGIALMTPMALGGALVYSVQSMLVVAGMFLCCGIVERLAGTDDMDKLGGLHRRAPWLSVLMLVAAMSTVGLPPFSGFYGKLMILREAFDPAQGAAWRVLAGAVIVSGALTLVVMAKLYVRVFWTSPTGEPEGQSHLSFPGRTGGLRGAYVSSSLLLGASVLIGLAPESLVSTSLVATSEASEPRRYVTAVLGEEAWDDDGAAPSLAIYEALADAAATGGHVKGDH